MKNLLLEKLLTLYYQTFYSGVYDSIHKIPAFAWDKIEDGTNFFMLIKNEENRKRIEGDENRITKWLESGALESAYEKIYNQKLKDFPPKEYFKDVQIRKDIALMRSKAALNNQRHLNTLATLKELEYESKKKLQMKPKKGAFMKNVAAIENITKLKIEYLTISLFEYNHYITVLSNK